MTIQQQYIEFKVTHQRLERTDDFFVVGETKNYLKARFSFSDDWGEEIPIIIFAGDCHPYGVELVDGECLVPWEVLRCKSFLVSCMAGDRITTNAVVVPVCPTNAKDDLESPEEPTTSVLDAKIAVAVEKWLRDHLDDVNITIDLDAYATKEYVTEQISNSDYVTSDVLGDYPTTESMETYVADQINNSDYVTPEVLSDYATTEAMESYVTDQITNIDYITPDVLTDYTTIDHVETYVADQINNCGHITSDALVDYATVEEVEAYVDKAVENIELTETDPTVPAWAKQPQKPTYTAAEVGAATLKDIENALSDLPTGGSDKWEFIGEFNVGDEDVAEWWITEDSEGKPIELSKIYCVIQFQPAADATGDVTVYFGNGANKFPLATNSEFFAPKIYKSPRKENFFAEWFPLPENAYGTVGNFVRSFRQSALVTMQWACGQSDNRGINKQCLGGIVIAKNSRDVVIGANSTIKMWGVRM